MTSPDRLQADTVDALTAYGLACDMYARTGSPADGDKARTAYANVARLVGELADLARSPGVSLPRQAVTCPYCRTPVAGLLAPCDNPDCRRRAIDYDMRLVRMEDR